LFEILEHDIDYFSEYGNIFITGDMNSRVGEKLDFIVHDSVNNITDDNLYAPDCTSVRASVDKGSNSHGIKLIDLCKSTSLRIVNGRVGDNCRSTYFCHSGSSVIDFLVTSEFNEYSDHAPLHFSLYCDNKSPDYESYTDVRYKWDCALKDDFRAGIFLNLTHFDNTLRNIDCTNRESINNATCMFPETIRSVADPLFSKSFTYCNNPTFDTSQVLKMPIGLIENVKSHIEYISTVYACLIMIKLMLTEKLVNLEGLLEIF